MWRWLAALAVTLALVGGDAAFAQPQKKGTEKAAAKKEAATKTAEKPPIPRPEQLAMMIQTAMVAVSQANLTGNYSVLHALASPAFQKANPPEKLAKTFAKWREQKIDLTPVILYSPLLKAPPAIDDKNMLRLTGYYKTEPQQVHFDLLFHPVSGQWRLFGLNVQTVAPKVANAPDDKKGKAAKK